MKVFGFNNKLNGSYINSVDNSVGVNSGGGKFVKTEKGIAWEGNGSSSKIELNQVVSLGTVFSFTCIVRVTDNSLDFMAIGGYSDNSYPLLLAPATTTLYTHDNVNFASDSRPELFDSNWHMVTITRNGTSVYFYVDGNIGSEKTLATNNSISIDRLFLRGSGLFFKGLCSKIKIDDEILTQTQINNLYKDFLFPKATGLGIRFKGFPNKPTDLSSEDGLVAAYTYKDAYTGDVSGNRKHITQSGGLSTKNGIRFHGAGSGTSINWGNITGIRMRIKANTTTEYIGDLNATQSIDINSGTVRANNVTAPTIYVNGVVGSTILADVDNTIEILFNETVNASAFTWNKVGANYGDIEYLDMRAYNNAPTLSNIKKYHNQFVRTVIQADYKYDGIDNFPRDFIKGTGTFSIKELAASETSLGLPIGYKYLNTDSAGTCAIQNENAYGVVYEGAVYINTGSIPAIMPIAEKDKPFNDSSQNGYLIQSVIGNGILYFWKITNGGASALFATANNYITANTWYRIRVERTKAGKFTVLIRGGIFIPTTGYGEWTLVQPTGESLSGSPLVYTSNPKIDNTYTTSKYCVWDLDTNDRLGEFTIDNGIKQ